MPNRILRDWTNSEKVDLLSFQAEVLFLRLMMKADDYGSFYANPKLIKAAIFPLKDIREADITRWLNECLQAGLIAFYRESDKSYLVIKNFGQRLRTMNSKFPKPVDQITHDRNPSQVADISPPEEKRNETKPEGEEKGTVSPDLLKSNLFRQPKVPLLEDVDRVFMQQGGTMEMAKKFFNKHSSVGWFLNGSPITNFSNLVPGFISNWNKNNTGTTNHQVSKPGMLSSLVAQAEEQEALKKQAS